MGHIGGFGRALDEKIEIDNIIFLWVKMATNNQEGTSSNPKAPRMGQLWKHDEVVQLLKEVRKGVSREDIAKAHGRTAGGILSKLKGLAVDYHFGEGTPMKDIMRYTGLTEVQINEAIVKKETKEMDVVVKSEKVETILSLDTIIPDIKMKKYLSVNPSDIKHIIMLLHDIQAKLDILLKTNEDGNEL